MQVENFGTIQLQSTEEGILDNGEMDKMMIKLVIEVCPYECGKSAQDQKYGILEQKRDYIVGIALDNNPLGKPK